MKFLLMIVLALGFFVSCSPKKAENPGANAKTYTAEEFNEESYDIIRAAKSKKSGLSLKIDFTDDGLLSFDVKLPAQLKSTEQAKDLQQSIKDELESIDLFLKKYEGTFRIRFKDGDLKLMTLKPESLENIQVLKQKWKHALQALENIEVSKEETSEGKQE